MVSVSSTFRKSSCHRAMVLCILFFFPVFAAGVANGAVSMQAGDATVLEVQGTPQVDPYNPQQGSPATGAGSQDVRPFYRDQEDGASMMRTIPKPVDANNPGSMYYPYGGPVYVAPEIYVQPPWGGHYPGQGFPGWRPGQGTGWQPGRGGIPPRGSANTRP